MIQNLTIAVNVTITIAATIYFAVKASNEAAVIATFSVMAYLLTLQLSFKIDEKHNNSLNKMLTAIRIDKDLHKAEWTFDVLTQIGNICRHPKSSNPIIDKCLQESIIEGVKKAELVLQSGKRIPFVGIDKEIERQRWLLRAIENSRKEVYAVTSCDQQYIDSFWLDNREFSNRYIKANTTAAKRGVRIHRIFILPNAALDGIDQILCGKIAEIIKPMNNHNLRISFVSKEVMGASMANYVENNFLVVDEFFGSASNNFSQRHEGYVSIGEEALVNELKEIFEGLVLISRPANQSWIR